MNKFFKNYNQQELELMFTESEQSINKTGSFLEDDFIYHTFLKYQEQDEKAMPFVFLMELYHEICRRLVS